MIAWLLLLMAQSAGEAPYQKAHGLFVRQQFPAALQQLDEALRLDPKLVAAWTLRAKIGMATNDFGLARKSLEAALAVDPTAQYAQFLYGMEAYLTNDMQAALPRFRRAYELSPLDARVALYLGLTCESLGQTAEAMSLYEKAVRLEGKRPQAETLLPGGRLLLLLGRVDEAERWIRQALQLAPGLREPHFELARILLKKGQAAQAAAEGELALARAGGLTTDAQVHYLLIQAWRLAGEPAKSAAHAAILRAGEGR